MKQKLQAQRGATIMAALLFFLVASVCGSIILAAATATLSRVKNQAKDTQAYYAVTSAAQLIRDDLMDSKWIITLKDTYSVAGGTIKVSTEVTDILPVGKNQPVDIRLNPTALNNFIKDLSVKTVDQGYSIVTTNPFTITTTEIPNFPPVYFMAEECKLTTEIGEQSYPLTITITNNTDETNRFSEYKESDADGNQLYWVKLSLRSVKCPAGYQILTDARDESGNGIVTRTVCLGWDDPVIEKVTVS